MGRSRRAELRERYQIADPVSEKDHGASDAEALESPATLGANITASASARKAASNGVNVTVEQDGGITEADVYNAMNAALSRQDGRPIIVTVKADDREIARVGRKYA